jgi:hypothetical protein
MPVVDITTLSSSAVQQFMTAFNGAENSGHYKNCVKSHEAK